MRIISVIIMALLLGCKPNHSGKETNTDQPAAAADSAKRIWFPGEKHISNVRQLTFGGDNAEAYWSFNGSKIVFQRTDHKQYLCDQIFTGSYSADTSRPFQFGLASTGRGRTTCAAFLPGDSLILFASTHGAMDTCPPVPDRKKIGKYVWPLYDSYEIYVADLRGNTVRQLTQNNCYDAEATISPGGDRIIFTSTRDGDLDLYTMKPDGSDVKRITRETGYDGGAWYSPDGSMIVWRASRPDSLAEKEQYMELLSQGLVTPSHMEVWVARADGSEARKITNLGGANWAPTFTPDGKKILFASNHAYERGFPFNLYLINLDGTGLEQVTYSGVFDAFPMFSYDGKKLIWCSNRNNGGGRDTNVFVADWE